MIAAGRNFAGSNRAREHDHGSEFKHLTPVHEALRILVSNLPRKARHVETVPVSAALGRVLAMDLVSEVDVPPFDRAAMDGYAVVADDTYGATATAPVFLQSIGNVRMANPISIHVGKGQAVSIVTGGQMPEGANAVVMVEHTKQREDGTVEISEEAHPAENVSRAGEDVQRGAVLLKKGTILLPQDVGMLAYLGLREVAVVRKLGVAVLSTGSELHDGSTFVSGKIPDVNRPILLSAIRELGCEPLDLGLVADDFEQISVKLKQGIEDADVILVTAGTSVGPGDFVPQVINSLGKPGILVHGVAMRPSMPTGLAVVNGKPIISLPGYPVSAYLAFLEFMYPLVSYMLETSFLPKPIVKAKLNRRVAGVLGSKTYVRVLVSLNKDGLVAEPVRTSGAGILSSLVQANGLLIVPENVEGFEERELVNIELFRSPEREPTVE